MSSGMVVARRDHIKGTDIGPNLHGPCATSPTIVACIGIGPTLA